MAQIDAQQSMVPRPMVSPSRLGRRLRPWASFGMPDLFN